MKSSRSVPMVLAAVGLLAVGLTWAPLSSADSSPTPDCWVSIYGDIPKPNTEWEVDTTAAQALDGLANSLEVEANKLDRSRGTSTTATKELKARAHSLRKARQKSPEQRSAAGVKGQAFEVADTNGDTTARYLVTEVAPQDWRVTQEDMRVDLSQCD